MQIAYTFINEKGIEMINIAWLKSHVLQEEIQEIIKKSIGRQRPIQLVYLYTATILKYYCKPPLYQAVLEEVAEFLKKRYVDTGYVSLKEHELGLESALNFLTGIHEDENEPF